MASLLQSPSANLRRTPNERDHLEGSWCTKTGSAVSNGWSSGTRGSFSLLTQPVLVSGKLKENRAIRVPQIAEDDLGMFPGFQLLKRLLFLNMRPLAGPWSVYASPFTAWPARNRSNTCYPPPALQRQHLISNGVWYFSNAVTTHHD